jgi:hypothetical protein
LDDVRRPTMTPWLEMIDAKEGVDVIWCKSYTDFCNTVEERGLPQKVFFDHDLGMGPSGHDCAKWLVDYISEHNEDPTRIIYRSQSSNYPGKQNILGLIDNYMKFYTKTKSTQNEKIRI